MKLNGSTNKSLNDVTKKITQNMAKLASGKRIVTAKDDAAGLAVATAMLSQAGATRVGTRNASYGVSAAQIAEGAAQQLGGITTRMRELAIQSSNGTLSDSQRGALQAEFSALQEEAGRIVSTTEFNGQALLSGGGFSVQADATGDPSTDTIALENADIEGTLASANFDSFRIDDASSALAAADGARTRPWPTPV